MTHTTNDAPVTVEPDDCPYCGGAEEVLAVVADGSQDYIPCPHPCHRLAALASAPVGQTRDPYANDAAAKALYDSWSNLPGWVPWREHGNSNMQEKARREVAR